MKQIAIIGIQGVPAQYGGFESLVENIIGENCSSDIHYTIFCSSKDYVERRTTYKGASLKLYSAPCERHAKHALRHLVDVAGLPGL